MLPRPQRFLPLILAAMLFLAAAQYADARPGEDGKLGAGLRRAMALGTGDPGSIAALTASLALKGIELKVRDGMLKVDIYPRAGAPASRIAAALGVSPGFEPTLIKPWFIEAFASPEVVAALPGFPDVTFVELPRDYSLVVRDFGTRVIAARPAAADPNLRKVIRKTNLKKYWRRGYKGAGIRVGVIDRAFRGLDEMIAAGAVPPVPQDRRFNFVDTDAYGMDGPDTADSLHGTSTLEMVAAFAPEAELYAIRSLGYTGQFAGAVDKARELKLDFFLVNMGFVGYPDGDSPFSLAMAGGYSSKTLPIGSSNNQARSYTGLYRQKGYWTTFGEEESEYLEILDLGGRAVNVYLDWEPGQGADLVLELYNIRDDDLKFIDRVDNIGSEIHTQCWEQIIFHNIERPAIRVRAKQLGTPVRFRVLNMDLWSRLSIVNSATTMTTPSDARRTFSVGAVRAADFSPSGREFYSSFGPTADGRIKPDIMGASRLISRTWGGAEFFGTSCATPMVAGVLASYKSSLPRLKAAKIIKAIEENAVDAGPQGKDNSFGAGLIRLPRPAGKRAR